MVPVNADAFVVRAGFLHDVAFFALGDGVVLLIGEREQRIAAHKGGLLAAEPSLDGSYLATSGDDGLIRKIGIAGVVTTLAERPRKWIDLLTCGPDGAVAFAIGRMAWVRLKDGTENEFSHDRTVGGLAFAPKGMRLAVSRYNGATVWWAKAQSKVQDLEWNGAHLDLCFSPDGKYLVTSMHENSLHGWRLSDGQDMRMSGYPAKVKSWSWSVKGRFLSTSGANAAVLWPFSGKTGPMGQAPLQLGGRSDLLVTQIACHPKEELVAIGYQDGMIRLCRFSDDAEVLLREAGQGPVSSLAWDRTGMRLAFGTEEGEAGIIAMD